jgi:hypothetical protein
MLSVVGGCDSGTTKNNNNVDGGDAGVGDLAVPDLSVMVVMDMAVPVIPDQGLSDAYNCTGGAGCVCATGADCVSHVCDPTTHLCVNVSCSPPPPVGSSCATSFDCCGAACINHMCAGIKCTADNVSCSSDGECCSTKCVPGGAGMVCLTLNAPDGGTPPCRTAGNPCTNTAAGDGGAADGGQQTNECCNNLCTAQGQCAAPSQVSYCTQVNDICHHDAECCTGVCNVIAGTNVGTCAAISVTCGIDGTTCNGCDFCCSRFCGPFGNSGSDICQPASGCHVLGDTCKKNQDCCGGDPTLVAPGVNGFGQVVCTPDPTYPQIGTCSRPDHTNPNCTDPNNCKNTCIPTGDVCHLNPAPTCGANISINADCCQCVSTKTCCQPDRTGIPRCNLVGTCQGPGQDCTSAADCCNGLPCVPDSTGTLKCLSPPDGGTFPDGGCTPPGAPPCCVAVNGNCTTNSDCCNGLLCLTPPGTLGGTCINPTPDLGTPPDLANVDLAGVDLATPPPPPGDMAMCTATYGQSCTATGQPCCAGGIPCIEPATGAACAGGSSTCICFLNIP